MRHSRGFTLAELMVASTLFGVLMVSLYSAFHTGMLGYKKIDESIDMSFGAGQLLERISLDVRNSIVFSPQETKFTGQKDEVSFLALVDTYEAGELKPVYSFVSYRWDGQAATRLCRQNTESLNTGAGAEYEEMSAEIKDLAFAYGALNLQKRFVWKDSWAVGDAAADEKSQRPAAVRIRFTLRGKIEKEFERTIFLPLA